MRTRLLLALFGVSCAVEPAKQAAPQETNNPAICQERPRLVNFDSAPLGEVVKAISEATCKTFIVKEELKSRKLTLLAPTELAPAALLDTLRKALSVNGLELLEKDGVWSITQAAALTPEKEEPSIAPVSMPGVEKTGDLSVVIERKLIDAAFADPGELATMARVIPEMKDGEFQGFKLYGMRPTSLLGALGFKNGDTLQSINGKKIGSIEDATEMIPAIATQSDFQVEIIRRGAPITLSIQIK